MGNFQRKTCLINLKDVFDNGEDGMKLKPNKMNNALKVRKEVQDYLKTCDVVKIDLSGIRSLSPSFAYKAFGQLFEDPDQLDKLKNRLKFINDHLSLESRIWKAIDRRKIVLIGT